MNTHADIPALASLYPERQLRVHCCEEKLVVFLDATAHLEVNLHPTSSSTLEARLNHLHQGIEHQALLAALEATFTRRPSLTALTLATSSPAATEPLIADGLLSTAGQERFTCHAEALWQYPTPWLSKTSPGSVAQQWVSTAGERDPLRLPPSADVLYRRYIPWLNQTLTLRQADPAHDLHTFNRWMNNPRVAQFWEEEGSLEQHQAYLRKQLDDPHTLPLIGCFDGRPFGYFEVYWAKEDRIAPFYDALDHDRGMHLLVGEEAFRGKAFYTAWFSSICHYMFLDDPRTQRIVCEPRHDNLRQIANFDRCGFDRIKYFDFPHKRALLVMLTRERFFSERLYQPLDSVKPSKEGITV